MKNPTGQEIMDMEIMDKLERIRLEIKDTGKRIEELFKKIQERQKK